MRPELYEAEFVPSFERELKLIAGIKEWTGSPFIGDDCAVLPGRGLVTTDTLVEGTHFRLEWTDLLALGWKACAVNLSDIAAMAGRPRFLTVALTMPGDFGTSELRRLYLGLCDCAARYRARIVGGDLTSGEKLVINVTAMGDVHEAGIMRRSTAAVGEIVVVTGSFGGSGAALSLLNRLSQSETRPGPLGASLIPLALLRPGSHSQKLLQMHFRPEPRLSSAWHLVELTGGRGSLMDASDGLADGLVQIARASGVAMTIDLDKIPVPEAVYEYSRQWQKDPLAFALYGGEDYELVGTVPEELLPELLKLDPSFSPIGVVREGRSGEVMFREGGKISERLTGFADLSNCFQHFW